MAKPKGITLEVGGREVLVSNPDKPYFVTAGHSKLDVVKYYLAVADGALAGIRGRPIVLKRYVDGADKPAFYQKRAPESRPDWIQTTELSFPSGRTAEEIVVNDAAALAWIVNLGCIDLHPHPVRAKDLDHPDELRIDLDPVPGVPWDHVRRVAMVANAVLQDYGLAAWPKTSGSRGMHVNVRIEPRWGFTEVRRAALAVAREVERRAPDIATSKWWKEERHGVFLDYNQNAKDRTTASAWSVRPTVDARVSMTLEWSEVPECDPAAWTLVTAPARFAERGDAWAEMDDTPGSLDGLLELSRKDEEKGLGDAPWPPHFAKGADEPARVAPSRKKKEPAAEGAQGEAKKPATRRKSTVPMVVVAESEDKDAALAGLERWKAKYPAVAARLDVSDVLIDANRGRYKTWTRIRVKLANIPEAERPPQETPDPDDAPRPSWGQSAKPR